MNDSRDRFLAPRKMSRSRGTHCGAFRPQGLCIIAEQGVKLLRENQRHDANEACTPVGNALQFVKNNPLNRRLLPP